MTPTPEPISRMIEEFAKLPGIGPKSAARLTFYLLRSDNAAENLADAITDMRQRIIFCSTCFNITEQNPCAICGNPNREHNRICVVEEPLDVLAIERTGGYKGVYHVLGGAISPLEGIMVEDLKISELLTRLRGGRVEEVILATNPNLEGDATAMYLQRQIHPLGVRITRLARGLPMGGDLEYADEVTLTRAFEGRREM
jgi:recombination protein RecR